MKIIWTKHAEDRQKEWEKKLEITRQEVENILKNPEQIVFGDQTVLVAQSRRGKSAYCVLDE
jgi:predicted transcriptional regulator